jgi:hypothetical protein
MMDGRNMMHPQNSLIDSNANPKMETIKEKKVRVRSLVRNILGGGGGRVGVLGWGLRQMTSESIIHIDVHKPNNKFINAWLEQFWCMDEA